MPLGYDVVMMVEVKRRHLESNVFAIYFSKALVVAKRDIV